MNPSNRVPQPKQFQCVSQPIEIPADLVELIKTYKSATLIAAIAKSQYINWFIDNNVTVKTACWAVNNGETAIKPVYCLNCGKQLTEKQYTSGTKYCCIKCATTKYDIQQPDPKATILDREIVIPAEFKTIYEKSFCDKLNKAHSRTLYKNLILAGYKDWFKDNRVTVQVVFDCVAKGEFVLRPKICQKCGKLLSLTAIENHSVTCTTHIVQPVIPQQYESCGLKTIPVSNKEFQLIQLIHELVPNEPIEYNKKYPLNKKYGLDVYLPNRKLAFEFNGQYYHSSAFARNTPTYHKDKTDYALSCGIRIVHIFEHIWDHHRHKVESKIKSILGVDIIDVSATDLKAKQIDVETFKQFANQYDIEKPALVVYCIGLFDSDERLIAAGGWNEDNQLVQYVVKDRYNVKDGLSAVCSASKFDSCQYIVDRSFVDERYLDTIMVKQYYTQPTMRYVRGPIVVENDQPKNENVKWNKLYDCGSVVYRWTRQDANVAVNR